MSTFATGSINLIYRPTGGLITDARVIRDTLSALSRFRITDRHTNRRRLVDRARSWISRRLPVGKRVADLNIFFERIAPEWLPTARINVLVPNQEWVAPKTYRLLHSMDAILCKSRYGEKAFAKHYRGRISYIGFTSPDAYEPTVPVTTPFLFISPERARKKAATPYCEHGVAGRTGRVSRS